jgi:hypothetical protein
MTQQGPCPGLPVTLPSSLSVVSPIFRCELRVPARRRAVLPPKEQLRWAGVCPRSRSLSLAPLDTKGGIGTRMTAQMVTDGRQEASPASAIADGRNQASRPANL